MSRQAASLCMPDPRGPTSEGRKREWKTDDRTSKVSCSCHLPAFPELDTKRRVRSPPIGSRRAAFRCRLRRSPDAAGTDVEEVRRTSAGWIGVYTDEAKRVIGFWGLAIPRMKHRFEVGGVTLHAWCAFDTLFLPSSSGIRRGSNPHVRRAANRCASWCLRPGSNLPSPTPSSSLSSRPTSLASSKTSSGTSATASISSFARRRRCVDRKSCRDLPADTRRGGRTRATNERRSVRAPPRREGGLMKREIALIYDADSPNVPDARAALHEALTRSRLEPRWVEYDRASLDVPERFDASGRRRSSSTARM